MIDTGNAGSTIVEGYWIRRSGRAPHFAGGLDAGDGARLRRARIELGSLWLPHEIVAAFPQAVSGSESTTVEAAILSESIHERFVTTIDFQRRAMWLAPAAPVRTVFNRTGLSFRKRRDGDLDVAFVYARSPAAAAGIRAGDRVTAIDGRPASELSAADAIAENLAAVGTIRSYRVVRGNEAPRVVRVRLAELLP
jgi:membrane-associated protease RseP (regulator of RpoE activity)